MIERVSKLGATTAIGAVKTAGGQPRQHAGNMPAIESGKSLPKLIQLARTLAEQGPPVDYAKIAQIRQAIAQGTYKIDTDAIANAILRHDVKSDR